MCFNTGNLDFPQIKKVPKLKDAQGGYKHETEWATMIDFRDTGATEEEAACIKFNFEN